jgi:hypothetical protein
MAAQTVAKWVRPINWHWKITWAANNFWNEAAISCTTAVDSPRASKEGSWLGYSTAARWRDGGGIGRPSAFASSIHASTASITEARAAWAVSPSDMQPGKSGTSATKPPPSSCGNGSMMTGYSSFGIAGFSNSVDETYQPTDVYGLHRAPEWYGQDISLCRIRHLPVGAATTGWNTPDGMLAAKGCDVVDGPQITRIWPRRVGVAASSLDPCSRRLRPWTKHWRTTRFSHAAKPAAPAGVPLNCFALAEDGCSGRAEGTASGRKR